MALAPGVILDDKYRIIAPIGEGGMGSVFLAENVRIGRRVAVKVLHDTLDDREDLQERLRQEAQLTVKIGSLHVVDVIDFGDLPVSAEGHHRHYLVMEYLEGFDLQARLARGGTLPPSIASNYALQVLGALARAHGLGIVHHDLKPENVFIVQRDDRDFVKVLDFGLASRRERTYLRSTLRGGPREDLVVGMPSYMAPEKARGETSDGRADVYSVGVLLYESVSGHRPYANGSLANRVRRLVEEPPPPLTDFVPDIDPRFLAIVERAMHRDPRQRFQSADALAAALSGWRDERGLTEDRLSTDIQKIAQARAKSDPPTPLWTPPPRPAMRAEVRSRPSKATMRERRRLAKRLAALAAIALSLLVGASACASVEPAPPTPTPGLVAPPIDNVPYSAAPRAVLACEEGS